MADTRKPPDSPGGGPRKRAAPTIDLKATEVSDSPADKPADAPVSGPNAPEPVTPAESAPAGAVPPETVAEASTAEPTAAATEPPAQDPPPGEPTAHESAADDRPPRQPEPPPPPRGGIGAGIAGGVIGAVLVAAAAGGAWYGGYIPNASTQQQKQLPAQVAALQKQVQALQNRPLPKTDTSAIDSKIAALSQRMGKLENQINNLPATDKAATQRLGALDDTVKSLNDKVAALSQRADKIAAAAGQAQQDAASAQKAVGGLKQNVQQVATAQGQTPTVAPGQLDALQQKIAALEPLQKKVAALESQIASARDQINGEIKSVRGDVSNTQQKVAQATAGDRATRLALSATALRNAVLSGAPYTAQLAQAKSFGADNKTLAPLDRFAQTGVPTKNALANELSKIVPAMRKIAGAQKSGGDSFLDRLQANAGRLIRITPLQTPSGDDPADVLTRIDAEAAHADIGGALADLAKLPDNVRAPAKEWIAKAKARQATLAAARQFSANAARALGKG